MNSSAIQDLAPYKEQPDVAAYVEEYSSWVLSVARYVFIHYNVAGTEFQDYVQYGTLGMLEALSRFNPDTGSGFCSYAYLRVKGTILNNIYKFNEYSSHSRFRDSFISERTESIANDTDNEEDQYAALESVIVELAIGFSLEELVHEQQENSFPNPYESASDSQLAAVLKNSLEQLPEMEARVLRLHYFHQLPFAEIASIFQLSRSRTSQVHRKALETLAELLKTQPALIC